MFRIDIDFLKNQYILFYFDYLIELYFVIVFIYFLNLFRGLFVYYI